MEGNTRDVAGKRTRELVHPEEHLHPPEGRRTPNGERPTGVPEGLHRHPFTPLRASNAEERREDIVRLNRPRGGLKKGLELGYHARE